MHTIASFLHHSGLLTERLDVDVSDDDVMLSLASEDAGEPGPMHMLCIPRDMVPGVRAALDRVEVEAVDPRQGALL